MNPNWCITEIGGGRVLQTSGHLRLVVPPTPSDVYSDAQISDYNTRRDFRRLPPARLTVKARGEGGPSAPAAAPPWKRAIHVGSS
ncbi:hypothetical protein FBR01_20280 [Anaerolineae bacterium CFX8]|nr:hypothetical protein [Anaerolineae bacterium CFX8]